MTSAYLHATPQSILNDIDAQFTLHPALLTDLTDAFLREIKVGLEGYGEDMAMVLVFYLYLSSIFDTLPVHRSLQVFQMVQRLGLFFSILKFILY